MNGSPVMQRGTLLLEQRRYAEAEKYFREALASNPNDAYALFQLSLCEVNQDRPKEALSTIDRALSLAPEEAAAHALRAITLIGLHRQKEALASATEATRLDPDLDFAFTAKASVFLSQQEWSKAEIEARKALELNPENDTAANQLAHALRLQNRLSESGDQIDYMLGQDPESSENHSTAGWVSLQRGQQKKAEEHFLEALRLDASNEAAKDGLKEAFRARSPIYSAYLKYCFFMQRFTSDKQWAVMIGLVLGVNVIRKILPGPIGFAIICLYLLLVLWVHVARAVGNFQILFDRFARCALDRSEKWEAWFVGAGVVLGLVLLAAGFLTNLQILFVIGLTLIGAAFPLAYTFTNPSIPGRLVFGAAALFVYFAGFVNLMATLNPLPALNSTAMTLGLAAMITVVAVTWICSVPWLRRKG